MRSLSGFFKNKIIAQDLPMIKNNRRGQMVFLNRARDLSIVRTPGNTLRRRDENCGNGVMTRITGGIGIGIKLFRQSHIK